MYQYHRDRKEKRTMNISNDWDKEETYYLIGHLKVLGLAGARQVANKLGRSVNDVRLKYFLETSLKIKMTHHTAM